MPGPKRPTWMRILENLRRRGGQSANQLGKTLGMSAMGARQHLLRLEKDGLVVSHFEKRRTGRPALVFDLSEEASRHFPQGYDRFAESLLRDIEDAGGREKVVELFARRRQRLEEMYREKLAHVNDPLQRAAILAELRDSEGYMAEADLLEDGTIGLVEHNCPIAAVAKAYPEVCQAELDLFQNLCEGEVRRVEHIVQGHQSCVYRLSGTKSVTSKAEKSNASRDT